MKFIGGWTGEPEWIPTPCPFNHKCTNCEYDCDLDEMYDEVICDE